MQERCDATARLRATGGDLLGARTLDDVEKELLERLPRRGNAFDGDPLHPVQGFVNGLDGRRVKSRRAQQRVPTVGEQLVGRALRANLATVKNDHARADILNIGQEVRCQQDGLSSAAKLKNEILHLPSTDRVETRCRLIEDQQLGVIDQGLRETEAARHTLGKFAGRTMGDLGEADHFQQFLGASTASAPIETEEFAVVVDGLGRIEKAIKVGFLGQIADFTLHLNIARITTKHNQATSRAMKQPEDHLDGGRLTRSVGTEQTEDLVTVDVKIDPVNGARGGAHPEVTEGLGEARGVDDACFGTVLRTRHSYSSGDCIFTLTRRNSSALNYAQRLRWVLRPAGD